MEPRPAENGQISAGYPETRDDVPSEAFRSGGPARRGRPRPDPGRARHTATITTVITTIIRRCPTRSATFTITAPASRPAPSPSTTAPPRGSASRAPPPISARTAGGTPATEGAAGRRPSPAKSVNRPGRQALVAQLDRASDFDSEGREFESLRARQISTIHGQAAAIVFV